MGTVIHFVLERYQKADSVLEYSYEMLKDYDRRFSANSEESTLCKINKMAGVHPIKVDEDLFELIKIGKEASIESNLQLNIAIGALVKLWNIGFQTARVPNQSEIEKALDLINPQQIILDEDKKTVFLEKKGMRLDLGAIAKGYFADKLKAFWLEEGVKNGLIDLGRNIHTIGGSKQHNFDFWRIAIHNPFQENSSYAMPLDVRNKSIVTSGTYEKFLVKNDKRYHHLLSSITGEPLESDLVSLSVIANSSLQAEILSTELFSLHTKEIIEEISTINETEVIIIDKFKKIVSSL